jgi:hypothetical protein
MAAADSWEVLSANIINSISVMEAAFADARRPSRLATVSYGEERC